MTTTRASFSIWAGAWGLAGTLISGILLAGVAVAEERSAEAVSAGPAFDRAFSATGPAQEVGGGLAGKVVDRFAPPVASPMSTRSPGPPLAQTVGPLLRPCDTPGSGCRNPSPSSPQVVVPPILPGTRPPRTNP